MRFIRAKNINVFILFIIFILFYFIGYYFNNDQKVEAQQRSFNFSVYPFANYRNLGLAVEVGVDNLNNPNNNFEKFYNISPSVTILDKSFYRLRIFINNDPNTTITIDFIRIDPLSSRISINGNCSKLGGSVIGNTCVIYGMVSSTALNNNNYELWQMSVNVGRNVYTKYFYIVSSSTALNPPVHSDLYYLKPEATSVTLTNDNPSTTIKYFVYYKKLYCPNKLPNAESYISPTSSGFGTFTISGSDFADTDIYLNRLLFVASSVRSYKYFLSLKRLEDSIILSNTATIDVNNSNTPPTIFLTLTCSATPTTGLSIGSSTIYTLTASSTDILGNTTFTLAILNSNNGSSSFIRVFSGYVNRYNTSVATSVIWRATGTYYATGTVEALNTSTHAGCPVVTVGECECLYRTQSGGRLQIRCRKGGGWEDWNDYQGDPNDIPRECNCNNEDVQRRYGELCGM